MYAPRASTAPRSEARTTALQRDDHDRDEEQHLDVGRVQHGADEGANPVVIAMISAALAFSRSGAGASRGGTGAGRASPLRAREHVHLDLAAYPNDLVHERTAESVTCRGFPRTIRVTSRLEDGIGDSQARERRTTSPPSDSASRRWCCRGGRWLSRTDQCGPNHAHYALNAQLPHADDAGTASGCAEPGAISQGEP